MWLSPQYLFCFWETIIESSDNTGGGFNYRFCPIMGNNEAETGFPIPDFKAWDWQQNTGFPQKE